MYVIKRFLFTQVLKGNTDGDTVVGNKLDEAIIARVIRLKALQWNMYGMVCMRVEIYGCNTDKGIEQTQPILSKLEKYSKVFILKKNLYQAASGYFSVS